MSGTSNLEQFWMMLWFLLSPHKVCEGVFWEFLLWVVLGIQEEEWFIMNLRGDKIIFAQWGISVLKLIQNRNHQKEGWSIDHWPRRRSTLILQGWTHQGCATAPSPDRSTASSHLNLWPCANVWKLYLLALLIHRCFKCLFAFCCSVWVRPKNCKVVLGCL